MQHLVGNVTEGDVVVFAPGHLGVRHGSGGLAASPIFAQYDYNGAARIVVEDFDQPDLILSSRGSTAREYSGFDRFGRVVWHP